MTSYRFHWRPLKRGAADAGCLYIRIIHSRAYRDISTNYQVASGEWDPVDRRLKFPEGDAYRRTELSAIERRMEDDFDRLSEILVRLRERGPFTVADVVREFVGSRSGTTVGLFAYRTAMELSSAGRVRTARAYRSAARSLIGFAGRDISLSEISPALMHSFERYLLDRSLKMNTVSFYMRNLRAIYHRAVRAHIVEKDRPNPFENVFTGVFETRRRALDRNQINLLATLDTSLDAGTTSSGRSLSCGAVLSVERIQNIRKALKYFLFAFHSRGMSFVDLAYLKKPKSRETGYYTKEKRPAIL